MLTAATITDEQIRELKQTFTQADEEYWTCGMALYGRERASTDTRPCYRTAARARCAEILNTRKGT